ncbi:hypothetical protein [Botryobacter ruber]|uniref:hypothetical protein n=1 Tax=Botryobacter ruber TaxID=2171629 RepID=UPI000E0BFC5B|nr:hypothetical protein [Botryobacter ruber]
MSSTKEISKILNSYSTTQLTRVYDEFLRDFVQSQQELFRKHGVVPVSYMDRKGITEAMAAVYFYQDLFEAFLAVQPEELAKAFLSVIWDGKQRVDFLEEKYGVQLVNPEARIKVPLESLLPVCLFLKVGYKSTTGSDKKLPYYDLELDLDPDIRRHVKTITEPPVNAELQPVRELPEEVQVFGAPAFFDEYITLRTYLEQNPKEKLTIPNIKRVQKQLQIQEFYPTDKQLSYLRTRLLLQFISICLPKKPKSTEVHEQLKEAFERYKQWWYQNLPHLLFHLKGKKTLITESSTVNKVLFETLPELPYMQWVTADNLVAHIRYRRPELLPFQMYMVRNLLYVEQGVRKNELFVDDTTYFSLITEPLIKGSFFLYAALGLVDIAYTLPSADAVSAFDGLAYVRLTPLGAYVCGRNPAYQPPVAEAGAVGFELDEHRLLISVTGTSKMNVLLLEKYAGKTGENLYKVSYESFLSGCNTRKDIENKISSFEKEISAELPPVWVNFMASLLARHNRLRLRHDCRIYRLPPEDKELVALVARDEVLKSLVQKAEEYQVLVKDTDVPKFRARLRQFGYLFQD